MVALGQRPDLSDNTSLYAGTIVKAEWSMVEPAVKIGPGGVPSYHTGAPRYLSRPT